MLITAHSGALGTKPNSREYLNALRDKKIVADVFEVDVRCRKGQLYLSHLPPFFLNNKVSLREALSLVKETDLKVNLDIKEHGIFVAVQEEVISLGLDEDIIYTGNVSPADVQHLRAGFLYANVNPFCKGLRPAPEDAAALKKALGKYGSRVIGLNINYKWTEPKFYSAASNVGLPLSVYTVDDPIALEKLSRYHFANLTTHRPDEAAKYFKESGYYG